MNHAFWTKTHGRVAEPVFIRRDVTFKNEITFGQESERVNEHFVLLRLSPRPRCLPASLLNGSFLLLHLHLIMHSREWKLEGGDQGEQMAKRIRRLREGGREREREIGLRWEPCERTCIGDKGCVGYGNKETERKKYNAVHVQVDERDK